VVRTIVVRPCVDASAVPTTPRLATTPRQSETRTVHERPDHRDIGASFGADVLCYDPAALADCSPKRGVPADERRCVVAVHPDRRPTRREGAGDRVVFSDFLTPVLGA
jgi:hypothetical protein